MRAWMLGVVVLVALVLVPVAPADERVVSRVGFGSCANQDAPQPIWDAVLAARPDVFVMLGDNVYGDTTDMTVLAGKYAQLGRVEGFARLRAACPVVGTWDDHDYGENDAGREYPKRAESRDVMLDFFGERKDSPRRTREGVYDATVYGPAGRRVQVILLDTRWSRSPLARATGRRAGAGPYGPTDDPSQAMLGEAQWRWLEEQLRAPADVRILASSVQMIAAEHGWEGWYTMPREQARLFELIERTGAKGLIAISGDRHRAEISKKVLGNGYPLYDVTSSSLNRPSKEPMSGVDEPNRARVGRMFYAENFGMLEIDWEKGVVSMQVRDGKGKVVLREDVELAALSGR